MTTETEMGVRQPWATGRGELTATSSWKRRKIDSPLELQEGAGPADFLVF